jgi:hypothetical protein
MNVCARTTPSVVRLGGIEPELTSAEGGDRAPGREARPEMGSAAGRDNVSMRFDQRDPIGNEEDTRCRVCGREVELTFEHLPPRGAGNRGRAEVLGIDAWLRRDEHGSTERGRIVQRGSGVQSLCESCNNRSGRLYVPELLRWIDSANAGLAGLRNPSVQDADASTETSYVTAVFNDVQPARLTKQIVTMLLALSGPGFAALHLDLREYAQSPDWVGLTDRYRLYLQFCAGNMARFNGGAGRLSLREDGGHDLVYAVELVHPPFAYILTVDESSPTFECGDITGFADLGINQRAEAATIQMILGFSHTPLPLDLRSKAMVERDRAQNVADAERLGL